MTTSATVTLAARLALAMEHAAATGRLPRDPSKRRQAAVDALSDLNIPLSVQALGQALSGETLSFKAVVRVGLAHVLGVSPAWLVLNIGEMLPAINSPLSTNAQEHIQAGPYSHRSTVIRTVKVGSFDKTGNFQENNETKHIGISIKSLKFDASRKLNAFVIERSDIPFIPDGTVLLTEPGRPPKPNKLCLIELRDGRRLLLRYLVSSLSSLRCEAMDGQLSTLSTHDIVTCDAVVGTDLDPAIEITPE